MSVKATYFQFYFILFFIKGRSYFKAVVNDIFEFDHYIFHMNGALRKSSFLYQNKISHFLEYSSIQGNHA